VKAIGEYLYERGNSHVKYVRCRIPAEVRTAYPSSQTHIVLSLGTSDLREAKVRVRSELARIHEEFEQARLVLRYGSKDIGFKFIRRCGRFEVDGLVKSWARQILREAPDCPQGEEYSNFSGLAQARALLQAELEQLFKRMVTSSGMSCVVPTVQSLQFMAQKTFSVCHVQNRAIGFEQLRLMVRMLDPTQAQPPDVGVASINRLEPVVGQGDVPPAVHLPTTGHLQTQFPESQPSWDEVFATWRDYVPNRPKSTAIAAQTPWRDLKRFVVAHRQVERGESASCGSPAEVTDVEMSLFVSDMGKRGLAVDTINERLSKIKAIYKIAVGKFVLKVNPAIGTLGLKESSAKKRRKRRLPFDSQDLKVIFESEIFTQHKRSQGQAGEGSFWLPLLLFYTGARPEEVAGMAIQDVKEDANFGEVPLSHRRTLKNGHSVRRVPVARELIELGLFRYLDWLRSQGHTVMFPTLKKDWHGKLSGAFSKFFGRYKRVLGIYDSRKVLYSFRHTMKDFMEAAGIPSKYLQRLIGHTSGDGSITDGYGSDVPLKRVVAQFRRINFPPIAALPWEPGRGLVRLKCEEATFQQHE
jgi:integrase